MGGGGDGGGGSGWWQSALDGEGYEEGDRPSMCSDDREWTEGEVYALIATVLDILAAAPAPAPNPAAAAAAAAGRSAPLWPDVMALPSEAAATDGPTPALARPAVPPPPGARLPPSPLPPHLAGHQGAGQVSDPDRVAAVDPTYPESPPAPPRSPAAFNAAWSRLVGRGGWAAVCWSLYRRLGQLDDAAHDDACSRLALCFYGVGDGGEHSRPPLPHDFPRPSIGGGGSGGGGGCGGGGSAAGAYTRPLFSST